MLLMAGDSQSADLKLKLEMIMLFRIKALTKAYYDFWLNRDEEHEKQHYFSKHFAFTHLRFAVYDRTVPKS